MSCKLDGWCFDEETEVVVDGAELWAKIEDYGEAQDRLAWLECRGQAHASFSEDDARAEVGRIATELRVLLNLPPLP